MKDETNKFYNCSETRLLQISFVRTAEHAGQRRDVGVVRQRVRLVRGASLRTGVRQQAQEQVLQIREISMIQSHF